MRFEIHGDETGVTITTDQCTYELKPRGGIELDFKRDPRWRETIYSYPTLRDYAEFLTLSMELGDYRVTHYTEAPMNYGEGTWVH
ncbi:hypothetical protein ACFXG4_23385 [Nocardia sp. NPDC059246]|uniref:hypothetical protein n=1 Tax=unclassified Nocardia TaxID=2637762 RepID=UPI00367C32AE